MIFELPDRWCSLPAVGFFGENMLFVIILLIGWWLFGFWAALFFGAFAALVYWRVYTSLYAEIETLSTQIAQNEAVYQKNIDNLQKQLPIFAKGSNYTEANKEVFINVAEIASIKHLKVSGWGDARYLVVLNNGVRYLFTDFDTKTYDYARNQMTE